MRWSFVSRDGMRGWALRDDVGRVHGVITGPCEGGLYRYCFGYEHAGEFRAGFAATLWGAMNRSRVIAEARASTRVEASA